MLELELTESAANKKNTNAENEDDEENKRKNASIELDIIDSSDELDKDRQNRNDEGGYFNRRKVDNTELEFDDENRKKTTELVSEDEKDRENLSLIDKDSAEDAKDKNKPSADDDEDEKKRKPETKLLFDDSEEKEKAKNKLNDEDDNEKKKKLLNLDIIDSSKDDKKDDLNEDDESNHRKGNSNLKALDEDDTLKAKSNQKDEEDDINRKKVDLNPLDLESNSSKKPTGKVDKIDTYMRSKNLKPRDQDWDIVNKKDESSTEKASKNQSTNELDHSLKRKDAGEITIDYRKLREEFSENMRSSNKAPNRSDEEHFNTAEEIEEQAQVVELKANGFDFAISVINQYYNLQEKPEEILTTIARKLFKEEKGYCALYSYQTFSNSHQEVYNGFSVLQPSQLEYWNEFIKDESNLAHLYTKSMSTWMCRAIPDKDSYWSDTDLPSWANQELTNKVVELVYPFYDGLDRMGMAYVYFPDGIRPQNEKKIIILLELMRGILLDKIQRATTNADENDDEKNNKKESTSGKVLSMFGGLFSKKKTG